MVGSIRARLFIELNLALDTNKLLDVHRPVDQTIYQGTTIEQQTDFPLRKVPTYFTE